MDKLIEAVRESLNRGDVTMAGLARESGCTRQHLYGVLEGNHRLSLQRAEKIANALGMEVVLTKAPEKISA